MTIGPSLRLVGPLAKGGMGSLWIAEHLALQTHVAVKFLSEGRLSETATDRFEQEAAAMARLKSPHVVQVFDFGLAANGIPYIVMELLEGESLGTRLRERRRLSLVETGAIVMQTCRALSRAHELDVVHRDIKPDNIFLIDSSGELFVKVLDFGIAKRTGPGSLAITHSGMTMGTPLYMSPEQILSARTVTRSADLWAVAAVAYECLTGRVPFAGESYGGLCLAISAGRFDAPSHLQPELPASLDAWFKRAFDPEDKVRFHSAGDLARSFLAAALVSRAEAMTVPSGLGQRAVSYPSAGRLLTVQVEGGPTRLPAAPRELPSDIQVPTQRSVVAEQADGQQVSRTSLGGASISSPPVTGHRSSARPAEGRWRFATFAILGVAATVAVAIERRSPPLPVTARAHHPRNAEGGDAIPAVAEPALTAVVPVTARSAADGSGADGGGAMELRTDAAPSGMVPTSSPGAAGREPAP